MTKLKKVISLSEASKISGYHSDYLSSLIRKGELKGKKVGGNWFTTEEELKEYTFRKKIRHKKFALTEFFSRKKTLSILSWGLILFAIIGLIGFYLNDKNKKVIWQEGKSTLSSDMEVIN